MKRRLTRFSVRSLLALVTLCGLALGAFAIFIRADYQAYYRERQALAELQDIEGGLTFKRQPRGPAWLQRWRDRVYSYRVVTLWITSKSLSADYFANVAQLEHLESLTICEGNAIRAEALEPLRRLKSLRSLTLRSTDVRGSGKHTLRGLGLEKLKILARGFEITQANWIEDLEELKQLELYAPVSDADLEALAVSSRLEELTIDSDLVTDEGLAHLARFGSLRKLELRCPVSDAGLVQLVPLKKLERLVCRPDAEAAKLVDKLLMSVRAKYIDIPLADAVPVMSRLTNVPIRIDDAELASAGLAAADVKLNVDVSCDLRQSLDAMLPPHGLGYFAEQDGLVITTRQAAARMRPGTTRLLEALPNLEVYVPW